MTWLIWDGTGLLAWEVLGVSNSGIVITSLHCLSHVSQSGLSKILKSAVMAMAMSYNWPFYWDYDGLYVL